MNTSEENEISHRGCPKGIELILHTFFLIRFLSNSICYFVKGKKYTKMLMDRDPNDKIFIKIMPM